MTTDLIIMRVNVRTTTTTTTTTKYCLFLDLSAASCKLGFSANTILNIFAIFSSFLSGKLNFLPFAANFPPLH